MVLDMETEFYKLAKGILGRPDTFYRMFGLASNGRIGYMGVPRGVFMTTSLAEAVIKSRPAPEVYQMARDAGRDLFGSIRAEYDFEVDDLAPKKLMALALSILHSSGLGEFSLKKFKPARDVIEVEASCLVEDSMAEAPHRDFSAGLLAGTLSAVLKRDVDMVGGDTGTRKGRRTTRFSTGNRSQASIVGADRRC